MSEIFITFFLLVARVYAAQNCNAPPLIIPLTNVTLASGFQYRGLPLQFGTPPQQFSLTISGWYNNTVLEDRDQLKLCELDPIPVCTFRKGGVYSREKSSTWLSQTLEEFSGSRNDAQDYSVRGEDLMVAPNFSVPKFPIAVDQTYVPEANDRGKLGLGAASSLLDQLVREGRISSRTWSLDYGWDGSEDQDIGGWDDGNLVLGGTDNSRYTGTLYEQDFARKADGSVDQECHLKVVITGMTMQNSTAMVNLMPEGKSAAKLACITPEYPLLAIPYTMFDEFNNAMGMHYSDNRRSTGLLNNWGYVDQGPDFYDGNMTITLSNGFRATIPNHQLIKPYRQVEKDGEPLIVNGTASRVLTINALRPPSDKFIAQLGVPFLAAVYLIVDNDEGRFQLGESTRLHKSLRGEKFTATTKDIVRLPASDCPPLEDDSIKEGAVENSGAPPKATLPAAKTDTQIGPIVGGVVGGVLVALGTLGGFLFWRRKKRIAMDGDAQRLHKGEPPKYTASSNYYSAGPHEADSRAILQSEAPAELQAWRDVQELDGDHTHRLRP